MSRPLIFLDVDGPLIPFAPRPGNPHVTDDGGNPLLNRLDPADGRALRALPGDLVWATTWTHDANEVVGPRLGLPELPVVEWPDDDASVTPYGLHWKTITLSRWADGRSFVWLDDEITDADRAWVAAHHPERALLHRVDAQVGLSERDFAALERWLTGR